MSDVPMPNPMESAPRDGTPIWGIVDEDAIRMLWHEGFGAWVSSWQQMVMAAGWTIDGASTKDHSPVTHEPRAWLPLPSWLKNDVAEVTDEKPR